MAGLNINCHVFGNSLFFLGLVIEVLLKVKKVLYLYVQDDEHKVPKTITSKSNRSSNSVGIQKWKYTPTEMFHFLKFILALIEVFLC